jgi:hypothetical protein
MLEMCLIAGVDDTMLAKNATDKIRTVRSIG